MDSKANTQGPFNPVPLYDRVVREARISFGTTLPDDAVVTAAHEAVDEFLVRKHARVTTFIPVLAMRRLREEFATFDAPTVTTESVTAR